MNCIFCICFLDKVESQLTIFNHDLHLLLGITYKDEINKNQCGKGRNRQSVEGKLV